MLASRKAPRRPGLWTSLLLRTARCCDWTCEPWLSFDGDRTAVTSAAHGAPLGWRLNGAVTVNRRYVNCLDQTLTFSRPAAESCDAREHGPDAVVHVGSAATSLGGSATGDSSGRPRWRLASRTSAGSARVYTFPCPTGVATAIINRTVERGLQERRTTKRIVIAPCQGPDWFHVAVNINAAA